MQTLLLSSGTLVGGRADFRSEEFQQFSNETAARPSIQEPAARVLIVADLAMRLVRGEEQGSQPCESEPCFGDGASLDSRAVWLIR